MSDYQLLYPGDDRIWIAPHTVQVVYRQLPTGEDVIGLTLHDSRLGELCVALTPAAAAGLAARITTTLENLDELRAEFCRLH